MIFFQGQIKAKILVGRYTLQEDMAKYKNSDPTCLLCRMEQENLHQFILKCPALETPRLKHITCLQKELTAHLGEEFAMQFTPTSPLLLKCIVDPTCMLEHYQIPEKAIRQIETSAGKLCYSLHTLRTSLIGNIKIHKKDADNKTTHVKKAKNPENSTTPLVVALIR